MSRIITRFVITTFLAATIQACDNAPPIAENIRSIKTIAVSRLADISTRKFSGVVMATDFSMLSFEVGGNVATVDVDIGDKISKGQKIAALNPKDFQLNLQAARADLVKARADQVHKNIEYKREVSIFEQGAGSQRQVDRTRYNFMASQAAVKYAQAKVNLAARDLNKTTLQAPYAGRIAKRMIQPFMEVKTGQAVFRIDAEGALEVWLGVPETVVNFLDVGSTASISFPTLKKQSIEGQISFLGSAAGEANLFPVKVGLNEKPDEVSPGMTAEVTLELNAEGQKKGILVPPISILTIVDKPRQGYVYVYDPKTSTVKKTLVHVAGGHENLGLVQEGLSSGDIIAIAGVSFLADGMKVKLMESDN